MQQCGVHHSLNKNIKTTRREQTGLAEAFDHFHGQGSDDLA